MAQSLKAFYWARQPLDGEAAHFADDIIVEGSDAEDSPSTKAERRRRREAIGRRYIEGYVPFIQSASLHGPFRPESGWENPWKPQQKGQFKPRPLNPTRVLHESKRITAPLEERESETLRGEIQILAHAEGEDRSKHVHGYNGIYNAENEDGIFENRHQSSHTEDRDDELQANFHAEHSSFVGDASRTGDNGDDILNAPQEDLVRVIQRSAHKESGGTAAASRQYRRKRKSDTSWLKGMHMLKRSRYEILEHSSPTPIAGIGRLISAQSNLRSSPPLRLTSPQKSLEASRAASIDQARRSSINIIMPSSATRNLSEIDHLVAPDSEAVEGHSKMQREQPQENGTIGTFVCDEIAFDNLPLEDVQGLSKATHLAPLGVNSSVAPRALQRWQLEIAEFSSSDLDGEETTRLMEVRQRAYDEAVLATSTLDAHSLNGLDVNASDAIISLNPISPASEGSFQYRRRNRKSKRKKGTPGAQHIAIVGGNLEESANQAEKQDFQYAEDVSRNMNVTLNLPTMGKACDNDDDEEGLKSSAGSRLEQLGRCRSKRLSHDSQLDTEADAANVSSPHLLSEDHMERHRVETSTSDTSNLQMARFVDRFSTSSEYVQRRGRMTSKVDRRTLEEQEEGQQSQSAMATVVGAQQQLKPGSSRNLSESFDHVVNAWTEHDPPMAQSTKLEDHPYGEMPGGKIAALEEEPDDNKQSPWMDVGVGDLQSAFSVGFSPNITDNDEGHNNTEIHSDNVHVGNTIPDRPPNQVHKTPPVMESTDAEEDTLNNPRPSRKNCREPRHATTQSLESFPSTQVLIDAATANPWNSSFKKSKSRKSIKRVSFGPLPSDTIDGNLSQPGSKVTERLESPPPPEGALRLTHLDDGFHYQLRATKNLEIEEESLTRFMNTPWEQIPAMKARQKPPSNSPTVNAMAEAFIAADRENLSKVSNMSRSPKSTKATMKKRGANVGSESLSRPVSEQQETQSDSSLDASFSIDPSGKVTAVNFDIGAFDTEDNLDAMIDDVGSFFKGWDVDSELKKAKRTTFEKRGRREHLSGLSNR